MNEREWAREHVTAAALDGLTAEESARFAAAADEELRLAADELRTVDRSLTALLADQHPSATWEAKLLKHWHDAATVQPKRRWAWRWRPNLSWGIAATVGLGAIGAGISSLTATGFLPTPGTDLFAIRGERFTPTASPEADLALSARQSALRNQTDASRAAGGIGGFGGGGIGGIGGGIGGIGGGIGGIGGIGGGIGGGGSGTTALRGELATNGTRFYSEENRNRSLQELTDQYRVQLGLQDQTAVTRTGKESKSNAGSGKVDSLDEKVLGDLNLALKERSLALRSKEHAESEKPLVGWKTDDANNTMNYQFFHWPVTDFVPANNSVNTVNAPADSEVELRAGLIPLESKGKSNTPAKPISATARVPELPALKAGVESKTAPAQTPPSTASPRKIIIRSGEIEFEVESFDGSVAAITKLVLGINGAFVATVNSEKMANGKVKGSVVVRVPPEALDALVLDLRRDLGKGGELKGQRIGSQDITKQYTDLESRLKAARTMETRLLEIIKNGKGEIKQLLEAEKELGVWRTKIEEIEGELRYYGNLASLSTLTITLAEKEIKTAAVLTESERITAGVEVEDVEKSYRDLQTAITEAKGRIIKAEMKQHSAGQFAASLQFEVSPEAAGPLRDRLKQVGNVARISIDRQQTSDGQPVPRETKVKRGDTFFDLSLYNLTNVTPRETASIQLASANVVDAYARLREAVTKAGGRILAANLNEQDRQNISATLDFDLRRADEAAIRAALEAAGEVISRQVTRAAEGPQQVTDSKILYRTRLFSTASISPRERHVLGTEVRDVDQALAVVGSYVQSVNGKQLDETSNRNRGNVTTRVIVQVPLSAATGLTDKVKSLGITRISNSTKDLHAPEGPLALARFEITLSNEEQIVAPDDGLWPQIRKGLSFSASVLLTSVTWIVFGLCVVLPWAIVGYGGYRLIRRFRRGNATATAS